MKNGIKSKTCYFKNPRKLIKAFGKIDMLNWVPDRQYLKLVYWGETGRKLNLKKPKTFNEKLQWIKIYDRKPEYSTYVDKYEVREYIAKTIGEEYLIPLIGVYKSVDEIPWDKFPNRFVLKCTHGSGSNIICQDKSKLDISNAKKKLSKWMDKNWYWFGREWPYKNIKPRIICEKYMVDESGVELKDYKFFCFNGEPKAMFVATDRGIDTRFDFYDMQFNHLPFMQHYKNAIKKINKPAGFDEMVTLSKMLSKGLPHVRVDFYDINGKVYFGELTFFHFSGFQRFEPQIYDDIFGSWIRLPLDEG